MVALHLFQHVKVMLLNGFVSVRVVVALELHLVSQLLSLSSWGAQLDHAVLHTSHDTFL